MQLTSRHENRFLMILSNKPKSLLWWCKRSFPW